MNKKAKPDANQNDAIEQDPSSRDSDPSVEQTDQQPEPVKLSLEDPGLDDQIAALEDQLITAQEDVLRAKAEAQNSANRARQQIEKAHKFALERFAGDLLPIVDNLERALESSGEAESDAITAIKEGVELTLKSFVDTLKRYNIEPMDPIGEPFDPQYHQAVTTVPNDDVEPNSVLVVTQKGYTLNQRLMRPAMVVVSSADK